MRCTLPWLTPAALAIIAPIQLRRLAGRFLQCQGDDTFGQVLAEPQDAVRPGLVAQKAVEACFA
jgi:hypothetical protein